MNYQIIKDPEKLREFINWLPNLQSNETYYICLMVRSKYCVNFPHIRSDKIQVKRFTSNKERLYEKIAQLECSEGTYYQREHPIPQEGLAIYITSNPRDMERASKNGLIRLANLITQPYNGYNPQQEMMSEIQKAGGIKYYVDFDFDNTTKLPEEEYLTYVTEQLGGRINPECVYLLQTRGGVHVLIDLGKVDSYYNKTWYNSIKSIKGCDQVSSDNMIPIPGCTQGGFVPKLIKL